MISNDVREAGLSDLGQLLEWGARFHEQSNWSHEPFDAERVKQTLLKMIEADGAVVLKHDRGMIGGLLTPLWFSTRTIAQELFWYAEDDGGRLLKAFEAWAARRDADYLMMTGLKDERGRIQRLYARKGYEVAEYLYRKKVSPWAQQQGLQSPAPVPSREAS